MGGVFKAPPFGWGCLLNLLPSKYGYLNSPENFLEVMISSGYYFDILLCLSKFQFLPKTRRCVMNVSKAVYFFPRVPKGQLEGRFHPNLSTTLSSFSRSVETRELESVSVEEIVSFLKTLTDGRKQVTKHARYSHLKTLFNFIKQNLSPGLPNPCDAPMLKKLFRCGKPVQWDTWRKKRLMKSSSERQR